MTLHYLKVAFRNLWKYRTQSIISIIGLSVGFACFAFCSYTLRVGLDFNKNIPDIDRICVVYSEKEDSKSTFVYRYAAEQLTKEFPEIESGTAYYLIMPDIERLCEVLNEDETKSWHRENFIFTDHHFLDVLGLRLLQGNKEEFLTQPNAVLLTKKTALRFFGTTDIVGRTFTDIDDFNDKQDVFIICGVIENFPGQSQYEQYAGIELNNSIVNNPDNFRMDAFMNLVKLHSRTDLKLLNQKLKNHVLTQSGDEKIVVQLIPLREQNKLYGNSTLSASLILFFIGLLLLLTALINYINFIFGQVLNRIKECGIRKVNGAVARDLFVSFFTEALLSFLLACCLGFLLILLLLNTIDLKSVFHIDLDPVFINHLLVQYTLIGIVVLGIICFLSTYKLINLPLIQSLHGGFVKYKKTEVRDIFLTVQLIICFLFLGTSWFLYVQSDHLRKEYTVQLSEEEKERIFSVSLNGDKLEVVRDQILGELEQNPDVELISRNGMSLLGGWQLGKGRFSWNEITKEQEETTIQHILTDANYLEIIKKEVREGRFFREEEPDKAVVNESFVKLFGRNPIGEQISVRVWDVVNSYIVVGVLPDIVNSSFRKEEPIFPCIYLPYPEGHVNLDCYVRVRKGSEEKFRKEITESLYRFVHPSTPIYIENLKEDSEFTVYSEQRLFKLIFPFSISCVIIGLLGMYASVLINTEKRKKEVAIRKINGAGVINIVWLFCKSKLLLVCAAALVALPLLYYGVILWLRNYAFRIDVNVFPFIVLTGIMALLVLLTILGQVIRISRLNPAETLKRS